MNDEDRKYLRAITKKMPSLEIFQRMVRILTDTHKETDRLFNTLDTTLLDASETIQA